MDIDLKPNQEVVIVIRNQTSESIHNEIERLIFQKESYLRLFIELLNKEEAHFDDFLPLKINLGELEAQANQAWQAIVQENLTQPAHAQELKKEFDDVLDDLTTLMADAILQVIPIKRTALEEKMRLYMSRQTINPAAMLDLQNAIQEYNLLVAEIDEQVKRVDKLRLFQL